jgi:hypothetical protein
MKANQLLVKFFVAALSVFLLLSPRAVAKEKKGQRGMLESMQSVPCGAKERGVTGLGSMVASLGVEHVNSHEQLCPQYLLRTDEMDYHIRPMDQKHAVVLPVGREAEFRIKKDRMFLKIPDGGKGYNKDLDYQVVAMQPHDATVENGANRVPQPVTPAPVNPASNNALPNTTPAASAAAPNPAAAQSNIAPSALPNPNPGTTTQATGRPPQ